MADNIIWKARKRNLLFFGLPWTFTVYSLDEDTFNMQKGLLNMTYEEIKLYKIRDFVIKRSLLQRIFGLGTIHICSADSSTPEFDVMNVKDCMEVKKIIASQVERARQDSGVTTSEFYVTDRPGQH